MSSKVISISNNHILCSIQHHKIRHIYHMMSNKVISVNNNHILVLYMGICGVLVMFSRWIQTVVTKWLIC